MTMDNGLRIHTSHKKIADINHWPRRDNGNQISQVSASIVARLVAESRTCQEVPTPKVGYQHIITARKRSLRRLCFTPVCQSFCSRGGCLPQCMLRYTPIQSRHPWKQTPLLGSRHPLGKQTCPPGSRHPPWEADTPGK